MINNPHYLYRMTILRAISLLAPVMGAEITCSKLLPVIISTSKDKYFNIYPYLCYSARFDIIAKFVKFLTAAMIAPCRVPNIKFNVAKVLESIFPIVDQSVRTSCFSYFAF